MTVVKVEDGKYEKPVATFNDNSRLSLNVTNSRALGRAYGTDSRDWIGMEVELYLGAIEYNHESKSSVLVRPLTSPTAATKPQAPLRQNPVLNSRMQVAADPKSAVAL